MKLSIIVPVYNMAEDGKLDYCMESLLNQTVTDYEIIAVDDCSTDASLEILKKYQTQHPELVKVFHHEVNRRQGGAKNTGLDAAQGEWIGFVDADDWVAPEFYEKLIRKGEETGADVVGCNYTLVTEHTMQVGKTVQNNDQSECGPATDETRRKLAMRPGSMVIKVYRHEMIRQNHLDFPDGIFYEDNCAGTVWMLCAGHFEKVEEPLYYYYQDPKSTVHLITQDKCRDRMKAGDLLYENCMARGFLEQYPNEIEYRYTEIYYATTLFSYLSGAEAAGIPAGQQREFIKKLRDGILRTFPDFQKNPYYNSMMGEEERKLIAVQCHSNLRFYTMYRLLHKVREWKSRK